MSSTHAHTTFSRGLLVLLMMLARSTVAAPPGPGALKLVVRSEPSQLVLPLASARVLIEGLPAGPWKVASNIGRPGSQRRQGKRLELEVALPTDAFPQRLCLLLVQTKLQPMVLLLPLKAVARVPVETRPNSLVTLHLGKQTFGPVRSNAQGRAELQVLVSPGVASAEARVVDDKGLETRKTVTVTQPTYPQLAILDQALAAPSPKQRAGRQVFIANADVAAKAPRALLRDPRGRTRSLTPARLRPGLWQIDWLPTKATPAGRWTLEIDGRKLSWQLAKPWRPPTPASRPRRSLTFWRRLRGTLGQSVGLLHNFGGLKSVHISFAGSVDHSLGPGRLGLRFGASIAWGSQTSSLAPPTGDVKTDVLLLPLSLAANYELAFGRLAPYASVGVALTIVQAATEGGPSVGSSRQTEVTAGLLTLLGARYRLGPGGLFAEAGYLHARIDTVDLDLRAGGLFVQAGYRLEFGAN